MHNDRTDPTYDPSNMAIQSQAGMAPISPMNVNSRGGNTAGNSQQVLGEGDYPEERKGGNAFINFITCRVCR